MQVNTDLPNLLGSKRNTSIQSADLWLINGDSKSDQMIGNFFLEAEVLDGLRLKTDFGFDLNWWDYRSFVPTYEFHAAAQNLTNDVYQGSGNFQGMQWENTANYTRTIDDKHNVDFLVGNVVPSESISPAWRVLVEHPNGQSVQSKFSIPRCGTGHLGLDLRRSISGLRFDQYVLTVAL